MRVHIANGVTRRWKKTKIGFKVLIKTDLVLFFLINKIYYIYVPNDFFFQKYIRLFYTFRPFPLECFLNYTTGRISKTLK